MAGVANSQRPAPVLSCPARFVRHKCDVIRLLAARLRARLKMDRADDAAWLRERLAAADGAAVALRMLSATGVDETGEPVREA